MLAILMVVLNGLVGTSLLVGGLRYHEQTYNLYGANAFLSLIVPLSVLGLVMPSFTVSSPGPTLSALQSTFLIMMSVGLYGVFLAIQTMRHRDYFVLTTAARDSIGHAGTRAVHDAQSTKYHTLLLLAYVPFIVLLAKQITRPIDYGTNVFGCRPHSAVCSSQHSSFRRNLWPPCVQRARIRFSALSTSRSEQRFRASA